MDTTKQHPIYRVQQTDCRTGWLVVNRAGRMVESYRSRESAVYAARDLNTAARNIGRS